MLQGPTRQVYFAIKQLISYRSAGPGPGCGAGGAAGRPRHGGAAGVPGPRQGGGCHPSAEDRAWLPGQTARPAA